MANPKPKKTGKEEKKKNDSDLASPIVDFIDKKFVELQFQYARNEFTQGIGGLFVAAKNEEVRAMYVSLEKIKEKQFKDVIIKHKNQRKEYLFIFIADRHGIRLGRYRKTLKIEISNMPPPTPKS